MNYGLLSYEFKKHFNVGDYVQSLAARQYLPRVDRFLNRETLNDYHGEPVRLMMNGWFMFHPENWPPAPGIEPLFVAFHINPGYADAMLTPEKAAYLRKYAPIGCRDEQTRATLEAHGVPARCTGCLTLTLGRTYRWTPSPNAPVLLADVLFKAPTVSSCFKSMNAFWKSVRTGKIFRIGRRRTFLKELLAGVEAPVETAGCDYPSADYPTPESRFALAEKLLERFSRARLVITSRIHVALPCLAMGTPVLFVDGELGKEAERARIEEFLPHFNRITIPQRGAWTANFDRTIPLVELRNPDDQTWRERAELLAKQCEEFVAASE